MLFSSSVDSAIRKFSVNAILKFSDNAILEFSWQSYVFAGLCKIARNGGRVLFSSSVDSAIRKVWPAVHSRKPGPAVKSFICSAQEFQRLGALAL